jgi:TolB-like protein
MTFMPDIEPVPPATSIVVLPFRDLSVAQGGASLGADLTDKIIADLSAKGDVHVITLMGNWEDSGIRRNVKVIGHELNARYVLEGSIRTAGDRVRITARLIDSNQDTHLWTEKFTDILDNMSGLQEQVSEAIGKALETLERPA